MIVENTELEPLEPLPFGAQGPPGFGLPAPPPPTLIGKVVAETGIAVDLAIGSPGAQATG